MISAEIIIHTYLTTTFNHQPRSQIKTSQIVGVGKVEFQKDTPLTTNELTM